MNETPAQERFEEEIADMLESAQIPFQRQASLQGLIVDFLIRRARARIVIEVKSWTDPVSRIARALRQAALIKQLTRVDRVYLAIAGLPQSDAERGVLALNDVAPTVAAELHRFELAERARRPALQSVHDAPRAALPEEGGKRPPRRPPAPKKRLFVAMPLDERFDDTYIVGVAGAAKLAHVFTKRIDQDRHTSDIVVRIKDTIRDFDGVIADLTDANPNVLFEVGYARALGKPVFQISSDPLSGLPFDVRNDRTLPYELGQTNQLRLELARDLRTILDKD